MSIVEILASSGKDKRGETIQSVNSEKERVTLLYQRLQLESKSFRINQSWAGGRGDIYKWVIMNLISSSGVQDVHTKRQTTIGMPIRIRWSVLLAIARVKVLLLIENTTDPLESELGVPLPANYWPPSKPWCTLENNYFVIYLYLVPIVLIY